MEKSNFRPVQSQPVNNQHIQRLKSNQISGNTFSLHFQQALQSNKLTVSKHAQERLHQRGIQINDLRWQQIEEKVNEAKKMGVKESLILLKDAALIVSAKNNTVITAMDREEARTQIFTNINGTIIMDQ
ncbi:flagellar protein [Bacillus sp. FJAT-29790]|uniref:TIGR02530 family flagellar biosynthesis protein n=1 Tax=Bacillus sp. FJAT-29790 TaxID=1895002 RepID=UPI001C24C9C1|nr:flagellar protein [Bacillus sp. FJAT-29790]